MQMSLVYAKCEKWRKMMEKVRKNVEKHEKSG